MIARLQFLCLARRSEQTAVSVIAKRFDLKTLASDTTKESPILMKKNMSYTCLTSGCSDPKNLNPCCR